MGDSDQQEKPPDPRGARRGNCSHDSFPSTEREKRLRWDSGGGTSAHAPDHVEYIRSLGRWKRGARKVGGILHCAPSLLGSFAPHRNPSGNSSRGVVLFRGVTARDRERLWHRGPAARLSQDRHRGMGAYASRVRGECVSGRSYFWVSRFTVTGTTTPGVTVRFLSSSRACSNYARTRDQRLRGKPSNAAPKLTPWRTGAGATMGWNSGAPAGQCLAPSSTNSVTQQRV